MNHLAAAGVVLVAAAFSVGDFLQALVFISAGMTAIAIGRAKRKDQTIHTLEESCDALKGLLETRERELKGASARANSEHHRGDEAERRATSLEATLAEVSKYTAGPALAEIKQLVLDLSGERKAEAARIEILVVEALRNNGELVLKNTELLARAIQTLEDLPQAIVVAVNK